MSSVEHPPGLSGAPPAARVLCACAADPEAPGASARLREALAAVADWERLGVAALRHGMAALLHRRVADLCPDAAPPEVLAVWRERSFEIAQRSLRMQRRLVTLAGGLAAAGVPVMAMKGPALSEQLYGDSNLRTFNDLDLLVSSADVVRAREAVLAAGYEDVHPIAAVSPDRLLEVMQEIVFREPKSRTIVELHWREGPRFAADSLPAEELAGRATSVELLGRRISVPGLPDVALLVAVHAATHDWQRFEDVTALAAALRRLTPQEAGELETLALAHACRRRLHVGVLLVMTLAGVSPPPAVRAAAEDDRTAKDLAAFYGARLLWDIDAGAVSGAAFGRAAGIRRGPAARAAEILREARALDSRRAAAGYVRRRLLTPGVNDWEHPDGGVDPGSAVTNAPDGASTARRALMTQLRRQRRMWRR
jgi:hypothetical protein